MILYHFPFSPFARRVRLALELKGLTAELRDPRADPAHLPDFQRLNPLHTVPVLVDGDRVVTDSHAILLHLDVAHPAPPLWPDGAEAVRAQEIIALADGAIQILVDLGLRYRPLHDHPGFPAVRETMIGRARGALDRLAAQAAAVPAGGMLCGARWSVADIALYTLVVWMEGMPARSPTTPFIATMLALGWSLPPALPAWADRHRGRPDVRALG